MNVKSTRRENLRLLAQAVGGITSLANRLNKSQGQISHLIGLNPTKNIGDKLAAEIEQAFNKPPGWLDWQQQNLSVELDRQEIRYIPVLAGTDIIEWLQPTNALKYRSNLQQLAVAAHFSSSAFAFKMPNDTMEAPLGVSFPKGATLIVEPECVMKDLSFVLVSLDHSRDLIVRQITHDGPQRLLKAINPRYPLIPLRDPYTIYGIVRMMAYSFE